jgi:fructokinase
MRIGIDLGGTKIEGVVLNDSNETLAKIRRPTPATDYRDILETIASIVIDLETEVGADCSVGVGTPGAISPHSGRLKNANTEVLNGKNLCFDLENILARKVYLANDANCLALSESVDGAARGERCVFAVIVGTGTGGGLVIDRQIMTGANAIAGEWGHNPLPWQDSTEHGVRCYCGKLGCIETFLSGAGLSRLHSQLGGPEVSAERVASLSQADQVIAAQAIEIYAGQFARALATVINVVDPGVVVVGGGLSKIPNLLQLVESRLQEFVFSDHVSTQLTVALHGDSSGVRGAAWLPP